MLLYQIDRFSTLALYGGMHSCYYLCSRALARSAQSWVVKPQSQFFIHTYYIALYDMCHYIKVLQLLLTSLVSLVVQPHLCKLFRTTLRNFCKK